MTYPSDFKAWQLQHYAQRLAEEKAKGNTKAVRFLRQELHRLKTKKEENA